MLIDSKKYIYENTYPSHFTQLWLKQYWNEAIEKGGIIKPKNEWIVNKMIDRKFIITIELIQVSHLQNKNKLIMMKCSAHIFDVYKKSKIKKK